jgi:hypothetical protein
VGRWSARSQCSPRSRRPPVPRSQCRRPRRTARPAEPSHDRRDTVARPPVPAGSGLAAGPPVPVWRSRSSTRAPTSATRSWPGRVNGGRDFLDNQANAAFDCAGHGTGVASIIIAAAPREGVNFVGLAPGVRILPVRVSERRHRGSTAPRHQLRKPRAVHLLQLPARPPTTAPDSVDSSPPQRLAVALRCSR